MNIAIIGAGDVGAALARSTTRAGYTVETWKIVGPTG